MNLQFEYVAGFLWYGCLCLPLTWLDLTAGLQRVLWAWAGPLESAEDWCRAGDASEPARSSAREVEVLMEEALAPQSEGRGGAEHASVPDVLKAVDTRRHEGRAQAFTELRLSEGLANDRLVSTCRMSVRHLGGCLRRRAGAPRFADANDGLMSTSRRRGMPWTPCMGCRTAPVLAAHDRLVPGSRFRRWRDISRAVGHLRRRWLRSSAGDLLWRRSLGSPAARGLPSFGWTRRRCAQRFDEARVD